jgi:hypothetical protein
MKQTKVDKVKKIAGVDVKRNENSLNFSWTNRFVSLYD